MRSTWLSTAAATALLATSGSVLAADLAIRKAPPPPLIPVYNWTGFYIGGNVGGAWETGTITDDFFGVSFSRTRSGFVGGGQVGYNWQVSPNWVVGVEGMFDGTDIRSDTSTVVLTNGDVISASAKTDWIATVGARLGYAVNNWLWYGKAGGGWVHDSATVTDVQPNGDVFSVSVSDTRGGWMAGGGIEYGFTPNWTARVDYTHIGLSDVTNTGLFVGDTITLSRHFDMVTAGINYKF